MIYINGKSIVDFGIINEDDGVDDITMDDEM